MTLCYLDNSWNAWECMGTFLEGGNGLNSIDCIRNRFTASLINYNSRRKLTISRDAQLSRPARQTQLSNEFINLPSQSEKSNAIASRRSNGDRGATV